MPEDLQWVIRYENDVAPVEGPNAGSAVFIDSMGLGGLTYANGIGLTIVADSTSFVQNDRFVFDVTNTEGTFSAFFRRRFQFQLPADVSPTIPDSLATA